MNDADKKSIPVTTFTPSPERSEDSKAGPEWNYPPVLMIGLGVTIIALVFVLFVLPGLVEPTAPAKRSPLDDTAPLSNGQSAESSRAVPQEPKIELSPFAQAQENKLRREAQSALESLLNLQNNLVALGVQNWAEPQYNLAIGEAKAGDNFYRDRDFPQATQQYQKSLTNLQAIEATLPKRIEDLHSRILDAIESLELLAAQDLFVKLSQIAPEDIRLINLTDRLAALPDVIRQLEQAESAAEAGDFELAVDAAMAAVNADIKHQNAASRLSHFENLWRDQRFKQSMTSGYASLTLERFEDTKKDFLIAKNLQPNNFEVDAAINELNQQEKRATLIRLRNISKSAESEEKWAQAVKAYREAIRIDANILFAVRGLPKAEQRADLDTRLSTIPQERDRLIDRRIMSEALVTLEEAIKVDAPGPKIRGQITAAKEALDYARTPTEITIESDGLTDITLLRVQRLGFINREVVAIRPGPHIAVGIREGYRDVRVEFEVGPEEAKRVEIKCAEVVGGNQ